MSKIRVFNIGLGTLSSSLARALILHREKKDLPWIWHKRVGGFDIDSIEIVGFADIDCRKINENTNPPIIPGFLLDDLKILRDHINNNLCVSDPEIFKNTLKKLEPDIVILAINSGEENTSRRYAEISADTGTSLVNTTPEYLARDPVISERFLGRGLLIVGDDLLSNIGGTILHKSMADFFKRRGLRILRSYQLDISGTLETLITSDERIRTKKRDIKSRSIEIEGVERIIAGTTDYVPFLEDQRISHIYMEILGPLDKIYRIEVKYWSFDGSSGVNTLLDVIRALAYVVKRFSGNREELIRYAEIISAYGFKAPPKSLRYGDALEIFEKTFCSW